MTRVAWIVLASAFATAVSMSSASAADLGGQMAVEGCNCGSSNMITIYDSEPGVVTRHWWADCSCRYAPAVRRPTIVAAPRALPQYESLIEPWRR